MGTKAFFSFIRLVVIAGDFWEEGGVGRAGGGGGGGIDGTIVVSPAISGREGNTDAL